MRARAKVNSLARPRAGVGRVRLSVPLALAVQAATGGCGSAHEHRPSLREIVDRSADRPTVGLAPQCEAAVDVRERAQVPIGVYAVSSERFSELRSSGYTLVGPWYDRQVDRDLLDAASAAGVGVVVPVGADNVRYHRDGVIDLGPDEAVALVREQVGALADHPAVALWYVMPEELRSWREGEIAYLEAVVAAVGEADPLDRPIVGYQPNERARAYLRPIAARLGGLAKGSYANYARHRLERAWVRWSAEELVATGADPAFAVVEMFEDPSSPEHVGAWARHDVYTSLISGADGVLVYSGAQRPGFTAHGEYSRAYAAVARELNGELAIGDALVAGRRCRPRTLRVIDGPSVQRFSADQEGQVRPSTATAERLRGRVRWTFVINSAADPVVIALDPPPRGTPVVGAEVAIPTGEGFWLAPWATVVWRDPQSIDTDD